MTLSPIEYKTICRNDLYTFMHGAFCQLNPQTPFFHSWHNELIASRLEDVRLGKIRRLIINVPPRSLKSHVATISFPAFLLGHNPSAQIICASYGQDLASKLSLDCRTLMSGVWYQGLFSTRLASQKQSVQEFLTTANGFRMATSVVGVLTGRGADFIIIDDPLKPEEAVSETQRKAVNEWYDHTLYSRLNDKSKGCIIIIMQRLHEDDLVGHVLEQEPWEHVCLPAIAEEDETHVFLSLHRTRTVYRKAGEALHPERESFDVLQGIRHTIGEYNFAAQYQQQPAPLGGGMVKAEWFRRYVPGAQPSKFELVIQSWDTANKCGELNDFSVCLTLGYKKKRFYILDVWRQRVDYPQLKRSVCSQAQLFAPNNILIEDKASGTQLIQDLIRDGIFNVTSYQPTMDKVMRMHSVTNTIENGFVYLPTEAEWLAVYLHELTTFPNGRYDDQADSTSQALDWAKQGIPTFPVFEYYRREAIRNGLPIDPSLFDDDLLVPEGEIIKCRNCDNTGAAQYGRTYHCNHCGHEWKDIRYWQYEEDIPRCQLETGELLVWDDGRASWVDVVNGDRYPEGPGAA